jgi:hypothetical protein
MASVTKPGVSIRAPANSTSRPSTSSLPGMRPSAISPWARRRMPSPSRLTSQAPIMLTRRRSPIVFNTPADPATRTITTSSTIGVTRKTRKRTRSTCACYGRGGSASLRPGDTR